MARECTLLELRFGDAPAGSPSDGTGGLGAVLVVVGVVAVLAALGRLAARSDGGPRNG